MGLCACLCVRECLLRHHSGQGVFNFCLQLSVTNGNTMLEQPSVVSFLWLCSMRKSLEFTFCFVLDHTLSLVPSLGLQGTSDQEPGCASVALILRSV